MPLYAAYGSNMDAEQMRRRCPHSPTAGVGWLEGWRITFGAEDLGWEGALPTIVEAPGSRVFVTLYDVLPVDEAALDAWEGADHGLYVKLRVRVQAMQGERLAWTYVLNGYEGGLPAARHLDLMAEAAERAGAPADYVSELRSRPCR